MQRRTASAAWRSVSPSMDLHHQHERQAPARYLHGTPPGRIAIGQELIIEERAELGMELHREVAFGKGGLHGGRSRRGHWGEG